MSVDKIKNSNIRTEDAVFIAKDIRNALIREWESAEGFVDKSKLNKKGIMAESIGLSSLMLLSTAFNDVGGFADNTDKEKLSRITHASINYIYEDINKPHPTKPSLKKGFTAEPIYSAESTAGLFSDKNGYTDTVTFVLSSMALTRYNQVNGYISVSEEDQKKMFELIKCTLKHLIYGQTETICINGKNVRYPGTWGFKTYSELTNDHTEDNSLYFTYACNTTLTDVFNYIFGEIRAVEEINTGSEEEMSENEYMDKELIGYLNEEFGNIYSILSNIRHNTSVWLLEQALPRLPKLAECRKLDAQSADVLGIWVPNRETGDDNDNGVNYLYLYPVYYLLDMMTNGYIDERFGEMINSALNPDFMKKLKESYNGIMSPLDRVYFFGEDSTADLYEEYYKGYIEQAIQTSRSKFLEASRTGVFFWSQYDPKTGNSNSELEINWPSCDFEEKSKIAAITGNQWPREPALISTSVKSNICFCYYISKERDFSVGKMFGEIIDDRSEISDDSRVKGLWDNLSYNLQVTERSIEALVDYFDYLNKFPEQNENAYMGEIYSSEIDQAIGKMIDARLKTFEIANAIETNKSIEKSINKYLEKIEESRTSEMEEAIEKIVSERMESIKTNMAPQAGSSASTPVAIGPVAEELVGLDDVSKLNIIDSFVTALIPYVEAITDVHKLKEDNVAGNILKKLTDIHCDIHVLVLLKRYYDATDQPVADSKKFKKQLEARLNSLSESIADTETTASWGDVYKYLMERKL